MQTTNINIVREVFEEIFAKGNTSLYDKYVDPNIQVHCPPSWGMLHQNDISGIANTQTIDEAYHRAFKMNSVDMHDIIANGDRVVVRWSCKGNHVEPFFGIKATHRPFELTGTGIFRLNNEKIVEVWQFWDMLGLLNQIKQN